jgi:hypothetical protein
MRMVKQTLSRTCEGPLRGAVDDGIIVIRHPHQTGVLYVISYVVADFKIF